MNILLDINALQKLESSNGEGTSIASRKQESYKFSIKPNETDGKSTKYFGKPVSKRVIVNSATALASEVVQGHCPEGALLD